MLISNTQEIPGKTIVAFHGVVSGSTVRAKHIGKDIMAGLKNIVNVRFATSSVAQGAAELFAYGTAVKVE
jgi:uncharacterized protein YbjQ (UPF0145 family)